MKTAIFGFLGVMSACGTPTPPPQQGNGPSGPDAPPQEVSVCDAAVANMIRIGAFMMAEVEPPKTAFERQVFCEIFESKGFDLKCAAEAPHIVALGKCRYKCELDSGDCH